MINDSDNTYTNVEKTFIMMSDYSVRFNHRGTYRLSELLNRAKKFVPTPLLPEVNNMIISVYEGDVMRGPEIIRYETYLDQVMLLLPVFDHLQKNFTEITYTYADFDHRQIVKARNPGKCEIIITYRAKKLDVAGGDIGVTIIVCDLLIQPPTIVRHNFSNDAFDLDQMIKVIG